jgi:hypothetical protein
MFGLKQQQDGGFSSCFDPILSFIVAAVEKMASK